MTYFSRFSRLIALPVLALAFGLAACDTPVTLIERAIEARSSSDIATDNRIVLEVNKIMADIENISASTEIYEQRLLITGLFSNEKDYRTFKQKVKQIDGIRKLYWHATYIPEDKQDRMRRRGELIGWADALELDARVGAGLIGKAGVSDVNFRVATDAFGTVYLLGRARSSQEARTARQIARQTRGARKVIDYVDVRP